MTEAGTKSVLVRIEGKVQGVWYRAWTSQEADRLGLVGWVRNRSDGSVEAVFSGSADAVDAMIEACRTGPPMARITEIHVEEADRPIDTGFRQLSTA